MSEFSGSQAGSPVLQRISKVILRLFGWRIDGELPDHRKMIIIGWPHTTNWDFPLAMVAVGALGIRIRYLGKHTLFRRPFGWFFRMLGGVPVDRTRPGGIVGQWVEAFESADDLVMVIAPEGTRSKRQYWKPGFYRIARAAQVPVVLAGIDGPSKTVTIGPNEVPGPDLKAYMDRVRAYYTNSRGIKPDRAGGILLQEEG